MKKLKVLAVIVNYGEDQLQYLEQVVRELKSFKKYNVTIIVNSNVKLDIAGIDYVNEVRLNDYQHLPATCKQVIHHYKDEFDGFIYTENDHLWQEHHLDNHIRYSELLPENRIPGLIQYEETPNGDKSYCAFLDNHFIKGSKEKHSDLEFCRLSNVHQASYFITKEQLYRVIQYNPKYFENLCSPDTKTMNYSVKCRVNTDLFEFSNWEKVICISEFEDNIIHHLPNFYVAGENGRAKFYRNHETMLEWIKEI
tara:strand:- start:22939 stop:23697 length:759 start_codon:yes stop_codon:yes gene_type:complete